MKFQDLNIANKYIFKRCFFFSVWHARLDARVYPRRETVNRGIVVVTSCIFCKASSREGAKSSSSAGGTKGPPSSCSMPSPSSIRSSDFGYALTSHRDVNESNSTRKWRGALLVITIAGPRMSREEEKKRSSTRDLAYNNFVFSFARWSTIDLEKSLGNRIAVAHQLILSSRSRRSSSSRACPYQRGRDREKMKYTVHGGDFAEPNGMLSGIWEVLAARSHLYATPGVTSPATRSPPAALALFSLLPCHRRRWISRLDLAARFSRSMFAPISVPWPFNLLADSLVKIR